MRKYITYILLIPFCIFLLIFWFYTVTSQFSAEFEPSTEIPHPMLQGPGNCYYIQLGWLGFKFTLLYNFILNINAFSHFEKHEQIKPINYWCRRERQQIFLSFKIASETQKKDFFKVYNFIMFINSYLFGVSEFLFKSANNPCWFFKIYFWLITTLFSS